MGARAAVRYSEAFKILVVREIESGQIGSLEAARRKYGIGGSTTLVRWLRRYGKAHLIPGVIRVEHREEQDRVRELERKVEQLQEALGEAYLRQMVAEAQLTVFCREQGIEDIEGYKKKLAVPPLGKPGTPRQGA